MSEWVSVIAGIFTLLLTAIGILVYNYLGHLSTEGEKNFKQFETAVTNLWTHIQSQRDGCTEMHLQIAREIGELRAKTEGNVTNLMALKTDFWEKMDRVTKFADKAKDEISALVVQLDNKLTMVLLNNKHNKPGG